MGRSTGRSHNEGRFHGQEDKAVKGGWVWARAEGRRYLVAGGACGYLLSALLFFDNRLSLVDGGFFKLSLYLGLFYGGICLVTGVAAVPLWRFVSRLAGQGIAPHEGRGGVVAGLLLFALLFFWNFDSFYHHSTFEFWLLVRRLLTESFVPFTAEGALNLGLLLLCAAAAAALAWGVVRMRRLLGEGRWRTLCRGGLAAALLFPWLVEAGMSLAGEAEPVPLLARPGRKVVLIGVDALDWKITNELMEAGDLPNLQALAARGTAAPLQTFVPAYSPMVWTTIATGRQSAEHNIRHFNAYSLGGVVAIQPLVEPSLLLGNPYVLRVLGQLGAIQPGSVTSNTRRTPAFWELASQADLTAMVLGWWATAPVESVNGIMVSDYATHTDLSTGELEAQVYPPVVTGMVAAELLAARNPSQEWLERLFSLTPDEWAQLKSAGPVPPAMREIIHSLEHDSGLLSIARHCLRAGQPEVLAVYLEGLDTVGHLALQYWLSTDPGSLDQAELRRYRGTARAYYRLVDQWIGELCQAVDPDTYVMVVSDHGFTMEQPPHYFHHKSGPAGMIFLSGPTIAPGTLDQAHVLDVAPTLLYLLGLPVAREMEGRVLEEAFVPAFKEKYPPVFIPSFAASRPSRYRGDGGSGRIAQASEAVVNRLKTLGYIE